MSTPNSPKGKKQMTSYLEVQEQIKKLQQHAEELKAAGEDLEQYRV